MVRKVRGVGGGETLTPRASFAKDNGAPTRGKCIRNLFVPRCLENRVTGVFRTKEHFWGLAILGSFQQTEGDGCGRRNLGNNKETLEKRRGQQRAASLEPGEERTECYQPSPRRPPNKHSCVRRVSRTSTPSPSPCELTAQHPLG